jgi:uncharacterized protein YbaP (TraB family)
MKRIVRAGLAALLGLATAAAVTAAAPAQPRPSPLPADPEGNIVEELVVTARHPAPAWWRVEKEGSTVWILGVLDTPLPPDVTWRREELDQRLEGASGLITGAQPHAGLEDIVGLIRLWSMLRTDDMEAALDPALRARFVADRTKLGKGPEPYAHWRPMIAGQVLLRDTRPAGSRDLGRQIRAEAGKRGVPARPAGEYDFVPFAKTALASLTPQSEGQCLAAALDDAEAGADAFRAAAVGWARGDVAAALKAPRRFDRCLLLMAGGPQLWRRSTDDLAEAIARSLETPGHAVAIVALRRLLARDGVVDTLKARGLKVVGPGDPEP